MEMMLLYSNLQQNLKVDTKNDNFSGVRFFQDLLPPNTISDYFDYKLLERAGEKEVENNIKESSNVVIICFPLFPKPHNLDVHADYELVNLWRRYM